MPSVERALEIVHATPADVGEVAPLFDAYRQFYQKPPDVEAARRFLFARLSKGESVLVSGAPCGQGGRICAALSGVFLGQPHAAVDSE